MESDSSAFESTPRIAYHNGRWTASDSLVLPVSDPAVTQGVTAVERLRAYRGNLFQVDRHLQRWERTTRVLEIEGLPEQQELRRVFEHLIQQNADWIESVDSFGMVMLATPGLAGRPTLVLDLYPISDKQMSKRVERGTPVVVTAIEQPSPACWPRDIKVRCRLHYYLADRHAGRVHPDAIGLLVDSDGTITDSSIANVLVVENNSLVSAPETQILCGVSMRVMRDLAEDRGISWREEPITPERLKSADEVLLTGTSCGVWFASSIDGVPTQPQRPLYQILRNAFEELVQTDASC